MTDRAGHQPGPLLLDGAREAGTTSLSLIQKIRLWRNRLLASARFRRLMMALPLTRGIGNRRANELFRLTSGFVHSQILSACVSLGVLDHLAQGWMPADRLARACGLPLDRMALLLRQAERIGLVVTTGDGLWTLGDHGAVVAGDRGLTEMIRHHDMFYRDLADIGGLLAGHAGPTALRRYWSYVRGEGVAGLEPGDVADYSGLMAESQAMMADCILAAHDVSRHACLMDVGGGEGAFLMAAARRHPGLGLVLFDLPAVAERAQARFEAAGLADRARVAGGDFVADPLPSGADCVTLIRILCDHDDDRAGRILANLHANLAPGTTLLVAEAMDGPSEGARLAATYFGFYFLAMGSGRCRSDSEICAMLEQAGFTSTRTVRTSNPLLATLVLAVR